MLFKRKENKETSKAKFSLFAKKSKGDVGEETKVPVQKAVKKDAPAKAKETKTLKQAVATGKVNAFILSRPRITEKASTVASENVYVFDVAPSANKKEIAAAVRDIYKITPVKVRTTSLPTTTARNRRGVYSTTGGGKKAYVYLKKGDTIELI